MHATAIRETFSLRSSFLRSFSPRSFSLRSFSPRSSSFGPDSRVGLRRTVFYEL